MLEALREAARRARSWCCTRAATTRPGSISKEDQWERVIEVVNARGLVPFLDLAYQGFADGLDADAAAVRRFSAACPVVFVSSSFSKSLSLYGERVGALHVVTRGRRRSRRAC